MPDGSQNGVQLLKVVERRLWEIEMGFLCSQSVLISLETQGTIRQPRFYLHQHLSDLVVSLSHEIVGDGLVNVGLVTVRAEIHGCERILAVLRHDGQQRFEVCRIALLRRRKVLLRFSGMKLSQPVTLCCRTPRFRDEPCPMLFAALRESCGTLSGHLGV